MLINAYKGFDIKNEKGQYVIYRIALSDFHAPSSAFIMGYAKTLKEAKQKATIYAENRKRAKI
jgi:hypothetical protein